MSPPMTPYTPEEIALAESIANDLEESGCLHGDWCDAYRAALAAIRATTERAAKIAAEEVAACEEGDDGDYWIAACIERRLRANEHLKDRPDAG